MPTVTMQTTGEGTSPVVGRVTPEPKAAIMEGLREVLRVVPGKPPEWTSVIIQVVDTENWGWGGLPVARSRKALAAAAGRSAA